jgi:NADH-quinone oxidoreductase subunit L
MGALKKKMPWTFWTFLIGTAALCGVPPLSGFYSKDSILAQAYETHHTGLFVLGVAVALLTTFYMTRLFVVVFLGQAKSHLSEHAHESPKVMTMPLVVLAVASAVGGFIGITQFVGKFLGAEHIGPVFDPLEPFHAAPVAALSGIAVVVVGFILAWSIYAKASVDPLPGKLGVISSAMKNKFYFDELYAHLIAYSQDALAWFIDGVDRCLAGFIRVLQGITELTGRALRLVQNGNLQTYTFLFAAGVAVLLYLVLFH